MPAQRRSTSPEGREDDSEGSLSYSSDKDEYVLVKLSDIRKEVQCPICLGIIRKTRTVMECLHRFCRECIDKSMRLGNNECPACRTHCASRRSLRDDPNYDALIAAIYPDLDKYEEEELALHEEDKRRNKQIQASIAQTFRRQSEAIAKRRTTAKVTAAAIVRKAHGKFRNVQSQNMSTRGKSRSKQHMGNLGTEDDEQTMLKHSSSGDEESQEIRQKARKRRASRSLPETSVNTDVHSDEHDEMDCGQTEVSRESTGASPGIGGNTEGLVWGKGGARSHMRHGSVSGTAGKQARSTRAAKIADYLLSKACEENENEFDIQFTFLPFDGEEDLPRLERPYLCCHPTISVNHLCKFLALKLSLPAEDLEIIVEKQRNPAEFGLQGKFSHLSNLGKGKATVSGSDNQKVVVIFEQEATLAGIYANCTECRGNLVLMYRRKL